MSQISIGDTDGTHTSATPNVDSGRKKHWRFDFKADFVTFVVEDTAYKVHAHRLSDYSSMWVQKLSSQPYARTFTLEDVSVRDMDAFLSILYPSYPVKIGEDLTSVEEWAAVLKLATLWKFGTIRELAIGVLQTRVSPIERLVLARAHDVQEWCTLAMVALYMRKEALTLDEMRLLSLADVARVVAAREHLRTDHSIALDESQVTSFLKGILESIKPKSSETLKTTPEVFPKALTSHSAAANTLSDPLSDNTLSDPLSDPLTTMGKRTLVEMLSTADYLSALTFLRQHNVSLFCSLLQDFSPAFVSKPCRLTALFDAILVYGATDAQSIVTGPLLLTALSQSIDAHTPPYIGDFNQPLNAKIVTNMLLPRVPGVRMFLVDMKNASTSYGDIILGSGR